jgi:hypothetical protein
MPGTISQIAALTLYGNYVLQNPATPLSAAFLSTNNFSFCESVTFVDRTSGAAPGQQVAETPYANDPLEWFARLQKEGVLGLRMYGSSSAQTGVADRMLVGFVGGGRWVIESYRGDLASYWESRWQVGDHNRADRKIWRVSYARILRSKPLDHGQPEDLEQLKQQVRQCLEEVASFSRSQKLDNFTRPFEAGLAKLNSPTDAAG